MASQHLEMVIRANPAQPVQEINNIIALFLQQWPGSEQLILEGVKKEIESALTNLEKTKEKPMAAARSAARSSKGRKKNIDQPTMKE